MLGYGCDIIRYFNHISPPSYPSVRAQAPFLTHTSTTMQVQKPTYAAKTPTSGPKA